MSPHELPTYARRSIRILLWDRAHLALGPPFNWFVEMRVHIPPHCPTWRLISDKAAPSPWGAVKPTRIHIKSAAGSTDEVGVTEKSVLSVLPKRSLFRKTAYRGNDDMKETR